MCASARGLRKRSLARTVNSRHSQETGCATPDPHANSPGARGRSFPLSVVPLPRPGCLTQAWGACGSGNPQVTGRLVVKRACHARAGRLPFRGRGEVPRSARGNPTWVCRCGAKLASCAWRGAWSQRRPDVVRIDRRLARASSLLADLAGRVRRCPDSCGVCRRFAGHVASRGTSPIGSMALRLPLQSHGSWQRRGTEGGASGGVHDEVVRGVWREAAIRGCANRGAALGCGVDGSCRASCECRR